MHREFQMVLEDIRETPSTGWKQDMEIMLLVLTDYNWDC